MTWEVTSLEEAEATEFVSAVDVSAAEQEAAEAAAQITTLEQRVLDGDDSVTAEEIEQQRGKSRFAKLRATAVGRKAERTRQAERLKACEVLRQEIEAHSTKTGQEMAKALRAAEDTLADLYRLEHERNQQVVGWRQRAHALKVPVHDSPFSPGPEHAHLGHNGHMIIAGRRRLDDRVEVEQWVNQVVARAKERGRGLGYDGVRGTADPAESAVKVDAEVDTEPAHDTEFWKNTQTGRVWEFGPGRLPEHAVDMVRVSRSEAKRLMGAAGH